MAMLSFDKSRFFDSLAMLTLLLLFLLLSQKISALDNNAPRLFPAAKQEQYDPQTTLLRTIDRKALQFRLLRLPAQTGDNNNDSNNNENPVIEAARQRFVQFLQHIPDYPEEYPVNPNHQQLVPIQSIHLHVVGNSSSSTVTATAKNNNIDLLSHNFDESYQIQIGSHDGAIITVQAKTDFGIVRGLESLAQLIEFGWMASTSSSTTSSLSSSSSSSGTKPTANPVFIIRNTPIFIADAPTYPYRGLMIDTARHYQPLDLILRNLNAMTMNKFNVLHWHVTDSQSWPFQSTTFPELSQQGAWDKHAVYTHDDIQEVIHEGYLRGIRVIPEFDLPGHSQVLIRSHPELMAHCGGHDQPLNPTLPEVYDFVEKLYQEVTTLFTDDFIHIGGDEVPLGCWKQDPAIQKWAKAHHDMTEYQLLNYFESILTDIVASCGKTPIVWQELLNEGVELPPGTIVDVWKGFDTKTIENATKRHYPVVISGCWYLDHLKDDWKTFYDCEPLAFNGTSAQKKLILGGHASMWGERVDATDFMERVWPRASAVAERLWSGSLPQSYRDLLSQTVEGRLVKFRCFMVLRNVSAAPIEPGSCRHEQQPFFVPPTRTRTTEERRQSATTTAGTVPRLRRSGIAEHGSSY